MKIKWEIEGAGCHLLGCGLKAHVLEIEDEELEGLTEQQRQKRIDDIVQDEFDRTIYPIWSE